MAGSFQLTIPFKLTAQHLTLLVRQIANKAPSAMLSGRQQSGSSLSTNRGDKGHVQISIPSCEPRSFQLEARGVFVWNVPWFSPITLRLIYLPLVVLSGFVVLLNVFQFYILLYGPQRCGELSKYFVEVQLNRNMLRTVGWFREDALEGDKLPFTAKRCLLLVCISGVSVEWNVWYDFSWVSGWMLTWCWQKCRRWVYSFAESWRNENYTHLKPHICFPFRSLLDFEHLIFSPGEGIRIRACSGDNNKRTNMSVHLGIHQIRGATERKLKSITEMRGKETLQTLHHFYLFRYISPRKVSFLSISLSSYLWCGWASSILNRFRSAEENHY